MNNYSRQLLALNDEQLEEFVRGWVDRKAKQYVEVTRFAGPGDKGRDVVGFRTPKRHEGPWENYQCKQYAGTLPTAAGLLELGKILYFAHCGEFTAPEAYFFVAPRGLNRNLRDLVFRPTELKQTLLAKWDDYCASKISEGTMIPLSPELKAFIERYDFTRVTQVGLDRILNDVDVKPLLHTWFGAELDPPPAGIVPADVEAREFNYVQQLVEAYGEREGSPFVSHVDAFRHPSHGAHLMRQRERYFAADAFRRFYRDNTEPEVLATFDDEIFHGVIETHDGEHRDSLTRADAVLSQAANVHPSGPLAKHARVPVRQGVCHHFANENRLKWRRG